MTNTAASARTPRNGGVQLSRIIDYLDNTIPLPQDLRSFLVYFAVLIGVVAGMLIHVLLSAQILQAEVELASMQDNHRMVERQNGELLWLIGRATNFENVKTKALAQGYFPIPDREFVEVDISDGEIRPLSASRSGNDAPDAVETPPEASTVEAGDEPAIDTDSQQELLTEGDEEQPAPAAGSPPNRVQVLRQWRRILQPGQSVRVPPPAATGAAESATPAEQPADDATEESLQPGWLDQLVGNVEDLFTRSAIR